MVQRGSGVVVGAERGERKMQGALVSLSVGQGISQGAVGRAALGCRRVAVNCRTHQRMAEFDTGVADGDERDGLGRGQVVDVQPQRRGGRVRVGISPLSLAAARTSTSRARCGSERKRWLNAHATGGFVE